MGQSLSTFHFFWVFSIKHYKILQQIIVKNVHTVSSAKYSNSQVFSLLP